MRLAQMLDWPMQEIAIHHFPDGESRVRALSAAKTTILYCSLNHPNEKLIELALAASALRDIGAQRLALAAPYFCYMRQDAAFEPGEAVSQSVIGEMAAHWFDRIITVEPHLHRTKSLNAIFPNTETASLSAAPLLAARIRAKSQSADCVIIGPDAESYTWAKSVADEVGAPCAVLKKVRSGDRNVTVTLNENVIIAGKRIFLVDDVASTGKTLGAAARLMKSRGAADVEAFVVHALFDDQAAQEMREAGISCVESTDSVRHATNTMQVASLLAEALRQEQAS